MAETGEAEYLKLLDDGVKWATELGLYVIIDWHSIGNLRTEMYQSDNYETTQKETFEFWRTMAKHFKGNNTVAFFELFNEPTVAGGQLGTCSWEQWKTLNEEMIGIIRAHGNDAIPLVAGFNWAYDLTPVKEYPINAAGIAYVSHPYPMKRSKPWEDKWTVDWGFVAKKHPLILTEIGFSGTEEVGAHVRSSAMNRTVRPSPNIPLNRASVGWAGSLTTAGPPVCFLIGILHPQGKENTLKSAFGT